MTGKPAARISDEVVRGKIITGSGTVLIGSQGGIACSSCPDGIKTGSPVNPQLGAKVLSGSADLDFALPGAMPLEWQRQYSSYVNADQGGYCGVLGYGWSMPLEVRLTLQESACLLHDTQGRTITFEALAEGQSLYSASEDIWLLRTGASTRVNSASQELPSLWWMDEQRREREASNASGPEPSAASPTKSSPNCPPGWYADKSQRFAHLPLDLVTRQNVIFASSGDGSVVWVFAPENWRAVQAHPDTALSAHWIVQAKLDRLGRMQRFRHEVVLGEERLTGIEDGTGRWYQLHYEQICPQKDKHPVESGYFWQADSGVRLTRVQLTQDPSEPGSKYPQTLVRYHYGGAGDLTEVHDRHGDVARRFAYKNHLMVFHQEKEGPEHHYRYERNAPGAKAIEQRNQEGLNYRFVYEPLSDEDGQPRCQAIVTDSLQRTETYIFKGAAGLERLVEHIRADGSRIERRYNPYGHLSGAIDALGRKSYRVVDAMGKVQSTQAPDGSTTRQEWDAATGLLMRQTDAMGRSTEYTYDAYHRTVSITRADGTCDTFAYPDPKQDIHNADKPCEITDASGATKQLAYTRVGQLASYTDCSGQTTRYSYTPRGQMAQQTNALGETVRYQYNARDELAAVQYADGSVERYEYGPTGQPTQVQVQGASNAIPSQSASAVQMQYDRWGRITERIHGGLSLVFAYDDAGRLVLLTNENGEHTRFHWDAMDRLIQETGFDHRVQSYQYDAAGQLTQSADGWDSEQTLPAHITRYEWNALGQLIARHQPANPDTPAQTTTYEWDKAGELRQANVRLQNQQLLSQVQIERDTLGRVTAETQRLYKADAGALGGVVEFEHRIAHTLNALGHRTASELEGLGQVGYLMYGAGHVHGITWQGQSVIDLEHDALHRETRRTVHGSGLIRELQWDSAGRWADMTTSGVRPLEQPSPIIAGALGHRHYHYDSLGQMIGVETPQGKSRYGYDAVGRLTAAQTPQAGLQRWQFDAAGNRLPMAHAANAHGSSEISGHLNATDRHRAELRQERAEQHPYLTAAELKEQLRDPHYNPLLGTGATQEAAEAHLAQARHWSGNRVDYYTNAQDPSSHGAKRHYRYDSRGNRIEMRDTHNQEHMRLGYDAGNQLIGIQLSETRGNKERAAHQYRYDAFGRRLSQYSRSTNEQGESHTRVDYYGWDGDRLVHTQRHTESQDLPEVIHTIYEPGSFTPLIQLRRPEKAPPLPTEQMLAQASPHIRNELREQLDNIDTLYTRMQKQWQQEEMQPAQMVHQLAQIDQLQRAQLKALEMRSEGIEIRIYHCDHLGTPQALINLQGEVEWAASLDAWGNIEDQYNPNDLYQPIRLPGQHEDEGVGLYYNRYRYYDPRMGGYINEDPIGLTEELNKFSYVHQNPLSKIDPFGLFAYHGNWCGWNWTGGYEKPWDKLSSAEKNNVKPPIDALDACCETHDKCHANCRESFPCNKQSQSRCLESCDRRLYYCAKDMKDGVMLRDYMRKSSPKAETSCGE